MPQLEKPTGYKNKTVRCFLSHPHFEFYKLFQELKKTVLFWEERNPMVCVPQNIFSIFQIKLLKCISSIVIPADAFDFYRRISISSPSSHLLYSIWCRLCPHHSMNIWNAVTCKYFSLYLIRNGNIGSIQKAEKHKENEIYIILSTTS